MDLKNSEALISCALCGEKVKTQLTLKLRLCPIEIGNFGKVLAVEVQQLSKLHQHPKLLDELLASHPGLSCLGEGMGHHGHGVQVIIEGNFKG